MQAKVHLVCMVDMTNMDSAKFNFNVTFSLQLPSQLPKLPLFLVRYFHFSSKTSHEIHVWKKHRRPECFKH